MKMRDIVLLAIGGVMCATITLADDAVRQMTESAAQDLLEAAYTEYHFRQTMMTNSELSVNAFFTVDAANKWRSLKDANFSNEQTRDFFVGAVQLRGPVSNKGSIAGFYNPWWDAILVTENYGEPVEMEGQPVTIRKVTDFVFLSGEQFRGEPSPEVPSAEAVLSKDHLLPMTVAVLSSKTRKKFDEMYGTLSGVPLLAEHPESSSETNIRQIQTRSALRLKMASDFIHCAKAHKEAWEIAKVLRDSKRGTFNLLFSSDYAKVMSSFFVKLPKTARTGFEPYCYYPASDGSNVRLYVFVNVNHPRLFALTYLGTGWGNTVFEWFDLARADEIVKAFKKAEEVRK